MGRSSSDAAAVHPQLSAPIYQLTRAGQSVMSTTPPPPPPPQSAAPSPAAGGAAAAQAADQSGKESVTVFTFLAYHAETDTSLVKCEWAGRQIFAFSALRNCSHELV